jgi:HEAT repeat protein
MASIKQVEQMLERQDIHGLVRAVRDSNPLIRRRAVQALGELKSPQGVPALSRALLRDKDQYVIRWSVESLKQIGTAHAVDVLTWAAFEDRRGLSTLAQQALVAIQTPEAAVATRVKEAISRFDQAALDALGPDAKRALDIVIRSKQFETWASGKRKQVLVAAVRVGARPPGRYRRELIEMGLFVSGVHTLGDLLFALGHRSALVRIAAADRLGATRQSWTTFSLNNRFRRELGAGGDRKAAIAMARAMSRLGNRRGHDYYRNILLGQDMHAAAEAARALGEIGTPEAIQTLFWFVVKPPPPPAYHNVPQVLTALEGIGAAAFPALKGLRTHEDRKVRLLLIQLLSKSGHPGVLSLLSELGRDADPEVQHSAIESIAEMNTPEAASALERLADSVPVEWLGRALAAVTHPAALRFLKSLNPATTILHGEVLEDNGKPLPHASVQVVHEHFFGDNVGWGWMAISARAETNEAGEFAMAVMDFTGTSIPRIKVSTPATAEYRESASFMAEIFLTKGEDNRVRVKVDRFFSRLVLLIRQREWSG